MSLPTLYKVYRGKVARLEAYGAFVELSGLSSNVSGLLHKSQVSMHRVENIDEILAIGEAVFVKVISLGDSAERPKISLTMKKIDQRTGEDGDPTNILLSQDSKRGRRVDDDDRKAHTLDAVLNVTCSKCGGTGHLSTFCFAEGKKYDLVPEGDDDVGGAGGPAPQPERRDRSDRERDERRDKDKDKDRKEERRSKEHKSSRDEKKKHKKKHKRKHDSSSSSSSSGSESDHEGGRMTYEEYMEKERKRHKKSSKDKKHRS